jgi:prepilin peptidase CpaA
MHATTTMTLLAMSLLLVLLLCAAVVTDLRSRRIPNRLVLIGLVMAFSLHAAAQIGGTATLAGPQWWAAPAGCAAGLAVLMPLYLMRACGAGDVKLMAMVGAFVGTKTVLAAALCTLLAGGLLSVMFMFGHGVAAQVMANLRFLLVDWMSRARGGHVVALAPLEHTAARLPYAVAIAMGTAAALLWPLIQR